MRRWRTWGTAFSDYFATGADDTTLVLVPIFHNTGFADRSRTCWSPVGARA